MTTLIRFLKSISWLFFLLFFPAIILFSLYMIAMVKGGSYAIYGIWFGLAEIGFWFSYLLDGVEIRTEGQQEEVWMKLSTQYYYIAMFFIGICTFFMNLFILF